MPEDKEEAQKTGTSDEPTIYEATAPTGSNGSVNKGNSIDLAAAIARRKANGDVVVCGSNDRKNKNKAAEIERGACGIGNYIWHSAHKTTAGSNALNHYQAIQSPPTGHCFYETQGQKAK